MSDSQPPLIPGVTPPPAAATRAGRRKATMANGYAARPGSGPDGETCRSCAFAHKVHGGTRDYWKCKLVKPTHGTGTDIRLKSPACIRWRTNP